ncbi:MAG: hypothetical protein LBV69_09580 [Bacteroidales bacterium]|jgi:hypothetical protein|nr:hypothetical protein [Bacteroidales bacterium]
MINRLLILTVILISFVLFFNSCITCKDCTQLKADYIAFSDNVYPSYKTNKTAPFNLETEKGKFKIGLMKLNTGEKTSAYYALDKGLDRVKNVRKKYMGRSPKSRYYIITLTDGLDNNSTTLAKIKGGNKQERDLKYEEKLKKELSKVMGSKKNRFQSYVMYYDAKDSYVLNEKGEKEYYTEQEIKDKLRVFSYGNNVATPEVIYIQNGEIKELATKFNEEFKTQAFSFIISKGYVGERIKMNLKNAENKEIEIEGTFMQAGNKYYLTDIKTSTGVTFDQSQSGKIMMSEFNEKSSTDVLFDVLSLRYMGNLFKVVGDEQHQKQLILTNGKWSPNVEYRAATIQITDAYILVILDVSKSFTVLNEAKQQINNIIDEITKK